MSLTNKPLSDTDPLQTIQRSYNDVNATLCVDGFLTGEVGRKVELAISTTSVANDTETYTFSESGTNLYVIKIIYTTGTRDTMISAERTN